MTCGSSALQDGVEGENEVPENQRLAQSAPVRQSGKMRRAMTRRWLFAGQNKRSTAKGVFVVMFPLRRWERQVGAAKRPHA